MSDESPTRQPRRTRVRSSNYTVARIHLWGHDVGAVAEDAEGNIVFEYEDNFRRSGLEISPIHLPLTLRGPVSFASLRRVETFAGLPGVLADALPDAFGNAIIRRYFEQRGRPDAALSPVQKLRCIGSRAMGALEFSPPLEGSVRREVDDPLAIAQLVEQARRVVDGDPTVAVPEMMQVGASAGGARAKALVLWNPPLARLRLAFATRGAGDEHWLIKFDGVSAAGGGHELAGSFVPAPFGRIEYAYSRLARVAGVEMAETHLLHERDFAHFMTRRFDREGDARLHMHSLGGLHHADYNVRQVMSYEEYFRTIRLLGMGQTAVDQAFRRMVFNMATRNQDDHVKNLALLMTPYGTWRLAPAFDLTFSYGGKWAATHQMTAGGKDDHFTRRDLLQLGASFDVPNGGAEILGEVDGALGLWEGAAREAGAERVTITRIGALFRRFG